MTRSVAGRRDPNDPHQVDPDGPQLFGQHCTGLMAGHRPDMPTHRDLLVEIWQRDRLGRFAQEHPAVDC